MNPTASCLAPITLLLALASGCATVRESARGLFTMEPAARAVATWAGPAAPLFAPLIEATRATFPEARIHVVPERYAVRFWLAGVIQQPAQAGFQLKERRTAEGKTVTDLVALPLRTSPSSADLPPQFLPHQRLVTELERRSRLRDGTGSW